MNHIPRSTRRHTQQATTRALALGVAAVAAVSLSACTAEPTTGGGADPEDITIGFIVKTNANPFWVYMQEKAKEAADAHGVTLMTAAGEADGDNEGQVAAIENMMTSGVDAIIIDPNDSTAIVPTLEAAQERGIATFAVDTQTENNEGVLGTWATDNTKGGELLGQYMRAVFDEQHSGEEPRVALLDLQEGVTVGVQRRTGFLEGFGIELDGPEIVGQQYTNGDQSKAQAAMENMLQAAPDINVAYSINEPAGTGGAEAIASAGKADGILLGSIDGSCDGVAMVENGAFTATVMQFPGRMAEMSIEAAIEYLQTGTEPEMPESGFVDTGTELITNQAVEGVESQDTEWGADNCWGDTGE
ncbi:substrate-binding domain-containing protein [Microbacterium sediminis]|uniref:Periplasmic binding protein domain-containing protein n=1 Tax=Microbacterium sediminis TaxID=904291 RepID=A0A1B9NCM3_9MICO|nr:substrate-binding domain-containing protein [Microbacterium sediminis]OCG74349.1 hypothetical protein A7J15_05795 [Microbacterium sediminis]